MKILEIIPNLNKTGGGEVFFVEFCKTLTTKYRDTELSIVVLYDPNQNETFLVKKIKELGVTVHFLHKKKGLDFSCSRRLRKVIKTIKPDIIHCHLRSTLTLYFSTICLHKKFKIFFTVHNIFCEMSKSEIFDKYLIKNGYMIPIGVSKITAESVKKITKRNCLYINNGVDLNRFHNNLSSRNREYDFIVIASFSYIKNQLYAIRCFEKITRQNKNLKLLLLGDGENKSNCEKYVKDNNIKNVIFCGNVSNPQDYLSKAKILLVPSLTEANPLVVNEAFASGVYVIANNVGGLPDLIINNQNGDLVSVGDEVTFSKAMLLRATDNNFLDKKRDENTKKICDYSIEKTVGQYLSLFQKYLS